MRHRWRRALSLEEFAQIAPCAQQLLPEELRRLFDLVDTNHDGEISADEFFSGFPRWRAQRARILRHLTNMPTLPGRAAAASVSGWANPCPLEMLGLPQDLVGRETLEHTVQARRVDGAGVAIRTSQPVGILPYSYLGSTGSISILPTGTGTGTGTLESFTLGGQCTFYS